MVSFWLNRSWPRKSALLARAVYERYTDLVEPYGMDECWLDVSGSVDLFGSGMDIAEEIRRTTRVELGLTVSIGVSYNKVFAKLGSDMKKSDAITEISENKIEGLVWTLPSGDLFYCGRATENKLAKYGIRTIGDIAKQPPDVLRRLLGVNGVMLWRFANGLDTSPVADRDYASPIKSIGHGITCVADLENVDEVWKVILDLSQDIGHRLRVHGLEATGAQITIKDDALMYKQYQAPLELATQSAMEIALIAQDLFRKNYRWACNVRSLTVRAINLIPKGQPQQLNLYIDNERREKRIQLEDTVEAIRQRFGKRSIIPATIMGNLKMPGVRSNEVIMPGMQNR